MAGEETYVARSFAGPAAISARSSLVAVQDTGFDAREGTSEWIRVASSRLLHGLPSSTLGAADLDFAGETIGVRNSILQAGEHTRAITIDVLDTLRFGLDGEGPSRAQIRNRTIGMEASTIHAPAGVEVLSIATLQDLTLDVPRHPDQVTVSMALETVGLYTSEIELGDIANRVAIHTGFQRSGNRLAEVAVEADDSRVAVAVAHSVLHTGGGDDQVWVSTRTATTDPVKGIGLLRSTIDLGAGDDLLRVDGAVSGSHLLPGEGRNTLLLERQVQDSTITLASGSSNEIALGLQDDVVSVSAEGPADLRITLGGGNDRLLLDSAGLRGSVSGGPGVDRLQMVEGVTGADAAMNQLALEEGAHGGWIDGLAWDGLEQFDLGDGEDTVLFPWPSAAEEHQLPVEITGGAGRDRFLFHAPDAPSFPLPSSLPAGTRPKLMDVTLALDATGGIGITDRFGWYSPPTPSPGKAAQPLSIHYLTPSDGSGLGTPSLLPIAPLGALLEGISSSRPSTSQLAIALDGTGGELLLISGGRTFPFVELPSFSGWPWPTR